MRQPFLNRVLPWAGLAAATLFVACNDPLDVADKNQPDVARVYATPSLVEAVASKLVQQIHQGMYGSTTNMLPAAYVMAFESASQLGNFYMGSRSSIPRIPIDNNRGNGAQSENLRIFDQMSRNGRSAANALTSLYAFKKANVSLGSAAQDARAFSMAYFSLGMAYGTAALMYDSVAVALPNISADSVPKLRPASEAMALSIQMLDSAFAWANGTDATTGANGWPIPDAWIPTPAATGISLDTWKRTIRSFRARFRAGVARTPTERAAVNWDAVIADATNGLTSDFAVQMSATNGWSNSMIGQFRTDPGWHQMPLMIIGMADTSGAYDAWLQTPITERTPFLIQTPDKRFPSGSTRGVQQAVTGTSKSGPTTAQGRLYYRNFPSGEDVNGWPFGTSWYQHWRLWAYTANSNNGPNYVFTQAENDMLAAEGYIMKQNVSAAVALVDKWRALSGLPATGVTSLTQQVAGGRACVPRVPQGPTYTTTVCGNLLEALKWEKRNETAMTGFAQWYIDGRGWGDLVQGTALEWPVPYQEMDARAEAYYNSQKAAGPSTYGFK
jgi:hypothetical protein